VAVHELPREAANLHGYFSNELDPVLEVDPGDAVRISVPNAGWDLAADEKLEPQNPELDTGHPMAGPIAVRGAKAGQTLVVRVEEVEVGEWGVTWAPEDHLVHWELGEGVGRALGLEVTLAPFLGVMGMPPLGREHRLQGARRRGDALPADPRRRRILLGRRPACGAGRW
jgi:acetamidase/formamidase